MKIARALTATAVLGLGLGAGPLLQAEAQQNNAGLEVYSGYCASCHDTAAGRAPVRFTIGQLGPNAIVQALTQGSMKSIGAGLTETQIHDVATYISGKEPTDPSAGPAPLANPCPKADPIKISANGWNGWSPDLANTRFQPKPGIKAADVPKLKVKWTFAYDGSKNTQVTAVGDRLFLGSTGGVVYSLNAKTGCSYWRYDAPAGVRAAVVVDKFAKSPSGYAVFVSDMSVTVKALDAMTGKVIWTSDKLETHPAAMLTGGAALHNGVLYVPVSSSEEVAAGRPGYICCSFRGSLVAIDEATGKQLWKTYAIPDEPKPYKADKPQLGPAGAAIWSRPTVDAKRGLVYVATGDSYTDVDTDRADALIAFDMKTGAVKWSNQVTPNDNFIVANCYSPEAIAANSNCPSPMGPDVDFGASPILQKMANGKDILLAGQKSGEVYGLDPDGGKTLWKVRLGVGSPAGGVEWGMASDKTQLYVAIADTNRPNGKPGLNAVKLATGDVAWTTPTPRLDCPQGKRCPVGQSAPVSLIPGVAFSGALDGHMRAYDAKTGAIIWDFDTTATPYDTVNGEEGVHGGAFDATGPTFVGGMMFVHSGYPGVMSAGNLGQNLLMAFSIDGK
ncbi:MAG: PQQ-binding-like beta-propeller repeat protein [Alphaproteobacteria bacterium]|nr:PQQ-binding-like beta-propeller repeat protein [Alphaproteobacteria bacterium]